MRKYIFTILLSTFTGIVFGYSIPKPIKSTRLIVTVKDQDFKPKKEKEINVTVSEYPFENAELIYASLVSYQQPYVVGISDTINIISNAKRLYVQIIYVGGRKDNLCSGKVFIIETGSDIECSIGADDFKFSGKDAARLNIQSQIHKLSFRANNANSKLLNNRKYYDYLAKCRSGLDSVFRLQMEVIEKNNLELGNSFSDILRANCYGNKYSEQYDLYDIYALEIPEFKSEFKKFLAIYPLFEKPKIADDLLSESPLFSNYVIRTMDIVEKMKLTIYSGPLPYVALDNIVGSIETQFSGKMKDKLLTLFNIRYRSNSKSSTFLEKSLSKVNDKSYRSLLVELHNRSQGFPFKDFSLQDTTGRYYNLKDFKDKVILFDFWYTGCINCMYLHTAMAPVYEYYKGNDRVVFVSVSIDKDKRKWINSVRGGKYTHEGGLNLYTNGNGEDIELIKYYKILGYPTMLLVSNGRLFSNNVPIPTVGIQPGLQISKGATDLIDVLEKALGNPR